MTEKAIGPTMALSHPAFRLPLHLVMAGLDPAIACDSLERAQLAPTVAEATKKGGGANSAALPAEAGDRDYQVNCAPSIRPCDVTVLCRQAAVEPATPLGPQPVVFATLTG